MCFGLRQLMSYNRACIVLEILQKMKIRTLVFCSLPTTRCLINFLKCIRNETENPVSGADFYQKWRKWALISVVKLVSANEQDRLSDMFWLCFSLFSGLFHLGIPHYGVLLHRLLHFCQVSSRYFFTSSGPDEFYILEFLILYSITSILWKFLLGILNYGWALVNFNMSLI